VFSQISIATEAMKYILVLWDDSYPEILKYTADRNVEFKVYLFLEAGKKLPFEMPQGCEKIEISSAPNLFTGVILWLAGQSMNSTYYYPRDEYEMLDNCESRWQCVKETFKDKFTMTWRNLHMNALLELFREQACLKCKVIFRGKYELNSHIRRTCYECKQPECNGQSHCEITLPICEKVNCSKSFKVCQTKAIEEHKNAHPECADCGKYFRDSYDRDYHNRNETCNHCKKLKCGNSKHHLQETILPVCTAVGCRIAYRPCSFSQAERVAHEATHPVCEACKKPFLRNYERDSHIQNEKCNYCKGMKCSGDADAHTECWQLNICKKLGCNLTYRKCSFSEEEKNKHLLLNHPMCLCGCETNVNRGDHDLFPCHECGKLFPTSQEWFKHSEDEDHLLLCPCQGKQLEKENKLAVCPVCVPRRKPYFSMGKKMRRHVEDFGQYKCKFKKCKDVYFLNDSILHKHNQKHHPSPSPVVPPVASVPSKAPATPSSQIQAFTSPAKLKPSEQDIAVQVHQNCTRQDYGMWTVTPKERETFDLAGNQIKAVLAAAKTFQIREQGSLVKNTAIPGYADFDFILEVRGSFTLANVEKEIDERLESLEECHFLYGEENIQTWMFDEISFDIVLAFPGDVKFKNWEENLKKIRGPHTKMHSFIRALKYWCRRSKAPIKSYVIELVGKYLFDTNDGCSFIEFLAFLIRSNWTLIPGIDEIPEDAAALTALATPVFSFLQEKK
jgi:hypothetical protein